MAQGKAWQGAGISRGTAGHLSNSMGEIQTAAGKLGKDQGFLTPASDWPRCRRMSAVRAGL